MAAADRYARAGRGGNWPTEAPRPGLSQLQTCAGRSSRRSAVPRHQAISGIAATLATMAELYERGGRGADFASFIAQIRHVTVGDPR